MMAITSRTSFDPGGSVAIWWVNHTKTFSDEINGGYVWSPKVNKDGGFNQTYLNLTLTRPGDKVISYARTKIRAIGVVSDKCREEPKPSEFGAAGDAWAKTGWMVPIEWELLNPPIGPKDHLSRIVPLLPPKHSPIRPDGNGNQVCYLTSISDALGALVLELAGDIRSELDELAHQARQEAACNAQEAAIAALPIPSTEKEQLVKARRGQGRFKLNVEAIEPCCRLTQIGDRRFLIASHIKPWVECTNAERLDGANGLLLSPHVDKLFDGGWISFEDDGQLLCAGPIVEGVLRTWGLNPQMKAGSFNPQQWVYLNYHREVTFATRRSAIKA
jgi:hypothetical protein